MTKSEAEKIFSNHWRNNQREDTRLYQALGILGISREDLRRFSREARKVTRSMPGCMILTPTSVGKRR